MSKNIELDIREVDSKDNKKNENNSSVKKESKKEAKKKAKSKKDAKKKAEAGPRHVHRGELQGVGEDGVHGDLPLISAPPPRARPRSGQTDRHLTRRQTRTSTYARRVRRCSNTWATTTTTTTGLQEGKWATSP